MASNRPGFQVHVRQGANITVYHANHLSYAMYDGTYHIVFNSSGALTTFPACQVVEVRWKDHGPTWCGECDNVLAHHPSDDDSYAGPDVSAPARPWQPVSAPTE